MTKLFVFLLALTLASIAAMWFIENDGSIIVEWMGYRIQTSVAFTVLAGLVAFIIFSTIMQMFIWLKNAPGNLKKASKDKKRDQGLTALTQGFAAIAAGDTKQAKKLTKQAVGCLGQVPITRLLEAQTAQLDGRMEEAKVHYTAMLESKETEVVAIKGLLIQAEKDGDLNKAIFLAEKAVNLQPNADWANKVLIRLYKLTKKWKEAEKLVQRAAKLKVIDQQKAKRTLAIIALAQCNEKRDRGNAPEALEHAHSAYKEMPEFAPVALAYADLLNKSDNRRKAIKVLENCWKHEPHPQVASLYMSLFSDESLEKQQKHADKLLNLKPNHIDSHIVVAKAALAADDASKARNHLKMALNMSETAAICNMMAEVEKQEESSQDVINQWLQRAQVSNPDPAWTCHKCGGVQKKWETNCNNCQSFDSLRWGENKPKVNIIRPKVELLNNAA